ncbi:MAG TPA: hypothetical protein PKA64_21715, partial [Myxococcota bacterium]|nr:hypothetical protein [Myxococcota bacterium]
MRRFVLWFFLAGCPQPGDGTGGGVTQEDPDGDPPVESDEPPAASDTAAPCAPTGFAADPVIWALPSAWGDALFDPYDAGAMIGNCQAGRPSWLLERMTPDYLPDLVVTQEACAEGPVGRTRWDVYEALPEGAFSEAPIVWTLPPVYQDARYDPFAGPNTIGDCVQGPPTLGLLDMNGDFYADLVVFDEPCLSGPLGAERWDVYLNDGSGFEERPVAWELPRGFGGTLFDPFPLAWNVPSCANEAPGYRLLDMDGDFLPDLVVTQEPCLDGPLGRARWDVYRNTGAGFAATPTPWRLPDAWSGALRDPLADVEGEAR